MISFFLIAVLFEKGDVSSRYLIPVWQEHPEAWEWVGRTPLIPLELIHLEQDTPVI